MNSKPQIANIAAQPVLRTTAVVSVDRIGATVAAEINVIYDALKAVGVAPKSGPYYRLMQLQEDGRMKIEVGVPVTSSIDLPMAHADHVEAGALPAGFAVIALHDQPIDKVEEARNSVFGTVLAKGLQPNGPGWVQFLINPAAPPRAGQPTAMIVVPVLSLAESKGRSAIAELSGVLAQTVAAPC